MAFVDAPLFPIVFTSVFIDCYDFRLIGYANGIGSSPEIDWESPKREETDKAGSLACGKCH